MTYGTPPSATLADAIQRLESENKKLHENIKFLAKAERGGILPPRDLLEEEPELDSSSAPEDGVVESSCETIHIAIVAAGYNTSRTVVTLVKSILFHRHHPLHLHFVSDAVGEHILGTVFQTWQLPAVNVSFYSTEDALKFVSWIPNSHYSGVYGLMKLTIASLLPRWVQKVIVLDTDLMLAADIAILWHFFRVISKSGKMLGLVENQSDWYLGNLWKSHHPWPALGRGFNTGVVLLDLKAMRERDWNGKWRQVASENLKTHHVTALADQDIINAVIKDSQDLHHILPCSWNVQLSEHSLSSFCFKNAKQFKIIHWNSPAKLRVENNHGPYFKSLYEALQNYDGDFFKHHLLEASCNGRQNLPPQDDSRETRDPCADFQREAKNIRRTHPFIVDYRRPSSELYDVTLVAQLSVDRAHMLEALCEQWSGPLSISLYATDAELSQILRAFESSEVLRNCRRLGLHFVHKSGGFYPVNYLRNVALDNAETAFVFLSDIDFLPMFGLHEYLKEAVSVLGQDKRALVVPAFETLSYKFDFPKDKKELLEMWDANEVSTFRARVWPEGHAPTNFKHWRGASSPYRITWEPNFEPYIVVSRNVSRYDERFSGFGWNKVSHVMELNYQHFEFVVLPLSFTVHMPHAPSGDIGRFRRDKRYRDCVQVLKMEFQKELTTKYN